MYIHIKQIFYLEICTEVETITTTLFTIRFNTYIFFVVSCVEL